LTLMNQPARKRTLVHLVNGTGHQDTAYFPPVELRDITIELPREVRTVQAVGLGRVLPVTSNGGRRIFTLPSLKAYEVLIVE
jgi:hypothetical protein